MRGIKVPSHQQKKGDQWHAVTGTQSDKANVIIVSCGGNNCGRFDDRLKSQLEKQIYAEIRPTTRNAVNLNVDPKSLRLDEFDDIKDEDITVFQRLRDNFQIARIVFMGICYRKGWHSETKALADQLNEYIETNLADKVVNIDRFLVEGCIKRDDVHLTNKGYRVFMDQIMNSVIMGYLQPFLREDKQARRDACIAAQA